MREILFRAFVKDKGKIYVVKRIDFDYGIVCFEEEDKPTDTMRTFEQVELMQFTGLTDKNGKKIFEGDIVELEEGFWEAIYNAVLIEKEERYAVYYDNGGARYDLKTQDNNLEFKRVAWHQLVEGIVEVIGNKWDNPELLKEQK